MDEPIFFVYASTSPEDEMGEFTTGTEKEMKDEFQRSIVDGTYPLIFFGRILQTAEASYNVNEYPM